MTIGILAPGAYIPRPRLAGRASARKGVRTMHRSPGHLNRRSVLKTGGALTAAMIAPGTGWAQAPKRGGTLRVSNGGDPPDLDVHQTVTYLTQFLAAPCYSTLLRIDSQDYNRLQP